MVQLRASLEAVVMQAWRDRWTDMEWSVNLKAALAEDTSELHKLCGLLLRQSTLSEVPNKLMFSYLSYTLSAQVVPHASFLEAVVEYKDFSRDQCIESILDLLNFVRDRLRCNFTEAYHCERFCAVLSELVSWFNTGLRSVIESRPSGGGGAFGGAVDKANYFGEIVATALAFLRQPFVSLCLYFNELQNPNDLKSQLNDIRQFQDVVAQTPWLTDALRNDFLCYAQKLIAVSQLMSSAQLGTSSLAAVGGGVPLGGGDPRDVNPHGAHPAAVTAAAVFGCVRVTEQCERVADTLCALQAALGLPWWLLLRDFMRGAFLMQLEHGPACRESTATAFAYLKVPRVIRCLRVRPNSTVTNQDIIQALEKIAAFYTLFNSLDLKTRYHCFRGFTTQMKHCENINEADENALLVIRGRDRTNIPDHSPSGGQNGVVLVLKAEGTVHTLEKSFNSDFATKRDKLILMMSHMITQNGRSFDYICAAHAATGKLLRFASKIHEFNKITERPASDPKVSPPSTGVTTAAGCEDETVRAQLFDLTFLLVTRIKSLYTDLPLSFDSNDFVSEWNRQLLSGFLSSDSDTTAASMVVENAIVDGDDEYVSKLESLKTGALYFEKDKCDFGSICLDVPGLCRTMLQMLRRKAISEEHLQTVFSTMQSVIYSPLLCMIQCLARLPKSPERETLTLMLKAFVDNATDSQERKSSENAPIDRWNFMVSTARPLLDQILVKEHYSCAQYVWLIQCARRTLPSAADLLSAPPSADALRNAFNYSLRQGWVSPAVFAVLDAAARHGRTSPGISDDWRVVWVEEMVGLINADEMSLGAEVCASVSLLNPTAADAMRMGRAVLDYVLRAGHEFYCVAPRGIVLARFLVQLAAIALHAALSPPPNDVDEPKAKLRKMETDSIEATSACTVVDVNVTPVDTPEIFLDYVFRRFADVCKEEELRPALYFVANFLRSASEQANGSAVRGLIARIPPNLVSQVIRIEPKVIGAPTVLMLYDLHDKQQRQRALQNLCLLRQFRQL